MFGGLSSYYSPRDREVHRSSGDASVATCRFDEMQQSRRAPIGASAPENGGACLAHFFVRLQGENAPMPQNRPDSRGFVRQPRVKGIAQATIEIEAAF